MSLPMLRLTNRTNRLLKAWPLTTGVPLAPGVWKSTDGGVLELEDGTRCPIQSRPLRFHRDGTVAWLLVDAEIPLKPRQKRVAVLQKGRGRVETGLKCVEGENGFHICSPHYEVRLSKRRFSLVESWKVGRQEMVGGETDILIETPPGKRYYASNAEHVGWKVVEKGPLRIVLEVEGRHRAGDGEELFNFRVRYVFRRSDPCVQISYRFTNREMPETGVTVSRIALLFPTALGRSSEHWIRQNNTGADWHSRRVVVRENVEILSTKAVNAAAQNRYGNAADGRIVVRNLDNFREKLGDYPYFLRPGNARTDMTGGLRGCQPYLMACGEGGRQMIAWFSEMDLNFPKGLAMDRGLLTADIWPSWAGDLTVRRGQSKEHDFFVGFTQGAEPDEVEGLYFDHEFSHMGIWGQSASSVEFVLDRDYAAAVGALGVHRYLRFDPDRYLPIETKLGTYQGRGVPSKGMMDIGDGVTADRSWCHNNENDLILDRLIEYLRREDWESRVGALRGARHNAHVDFIAFDPDPLRQGTMPAHCPEHVDGATYPSHMWVGGLLAAYVMTGNPDFEEAALSVGENMLRWQEQRPTIFYADSRECGWPMLAWVQLYEHTGNRKWLKAARKVYEFYRDRLNEEGMIEYDLPHGLGIYRTGYGEFIGWRAMFRYYELTGEKEVRDLLEKALPKVYLLKPERYAAGGWACNDLFPPWAAYTLTGERRFLEDNYSFLRYVLKQPGPFTWGGVDVHYYLAELDRLGALEAFCT